MDLIQVCSTSSAPIVRPLRTIGTAVESTSAALVVALALGDVPAERLHRDRIVGRPRGLATALGSELAISLPRPSMMKTSPSSLADALARDLLEPGRRPELVGDGRSDHLGLGGRIRLDLGVHAVADVGRSGTSRATITTSSV